MQLSWELWTGRGRRTTSTQVHFGQLEVLECLWPRDATEPEYTEVRAKSGCVCGRARSLQWGCRLGLTFASCVPSQILSFPSSPGSQASARPCAHLRHTQTLRRMSKVSHPSPCPGALGCFPSHLSASARTSLLAPSTPFARVQLEPTSRPGSP